VVQLTAADVDDYRQWVARTALGERSKAEYVGAVTRFQAWAAATARPVPTDALGRDHVTRDYQRYLLAERRLRPASVNAALSALNSYWTWLGIGPSTARRAPIPQAAPRGLTPTEERRLLRTAERSGPRDHAAILTFCLCGPRLAEMAALDTTDAAVTARTGALRIRYGKGGRYRETPIPAQGRDALRAWLTSRRPATVPALWTTRHGRRLSARGLDDLVHRIARQADVDASAHTLRHTAIHRAKRAGLDPFLIAEIFGHASIRTTQLYGMATADEKAAAVDGLRADY